MRTILVVEDHAESRSSLAWVLEKNGYAVRQASNGRAAVAAARREKLHGIVLDLKLPDMEGTAVLEAVLELHPGLPAVVVTGFGTIDTAVEAMKRGAADFLTKPIEVESLLATLAREIERASASGAVATPPSRATEEMGRLGIIGRSRAMLELFDTVKRLARHQSTILILGESGTGKELIARAVHALGPRRDGPFVAVNCATLAEALLESELFGYERGAFTSADRPKEGVMETAHGGTLLLDEVNEMGLGCQAKLLRAIERREFRRVGSTRKIAVDFHLLAASNANLEALVEARRFRSDLYFRLKVVTLTVPPLRDRQDAIPVLAQRFLEDVARQSGLVPKRLTPDALAQLARYRWPGNIRELRNCIESLTLTSPRAEIDVGDLPASVREASAVHEIRLQVGTRMEDAEREIIRRTVEAYPTLREAARVLGIGLRTLHTRLRQYGLRRAAASGSASSAAARDA
ncbi:MAG TPA: sigma-54 dependent transcriptional regulator [Vicinamibacteria bacterium]|nr:sigma-54 dependent transcriptional regulator [Vicinamibacteria bacterium]